MFCSKCGKESKEGEKFCQNCGAPLKNGVEKGGDSSKDADDNTKILKILSYIGILWLIGLFSNSKNDKSLKFHIGQGIILSIAEFAGGLVLWIFNVTVIANIFRTQIQFWGYSTGAYTTSWLGILIMWILNLALWGAILFLGIKGIINVQQNKDKKLPIIGKFSFYK
ncbi:MAG: zinc-ribbon domain-containing protein [Bacilli bacterium]|nr:zinc-ribbon domain-containing protein [Bacilli bacterium]